MRQSEVDGFLAGLLQSYGFNQKLNRGRKGKKREREGRETYQPRYPIDAMQHVGWASIHSHNHQPDAIFAKNDGIIEW